MERIRTLDWVAKQREQHYVSNNTTTQYRNEPAWPAPESIPADARKIALDFTLYHSPHIPDNSTIPCVYCHTLNADGVDGRKVSIGTDGTVGLTNAPTVFSPVFNAGQFRDGHAPTLWAQAGGPPLNPIEMASKSWDEIIQKLDKDPQLRQGSIAVYPQGFSGDDITDTIAEFEKTLTTLNSPFDRQLHGDRAVLTAQQKHGYQLLKDSEYATCRDDIILGGRSFEPLGLKKDFSFGEVTAIDIGRMNVTNELCGRPRRRAPGLCSVALTAPYFHRSDVPTLDDAAKLMPCHQVGEELPQEDIDNVVMFLGSLNGVYTPYIQGK